MLRAPARAPFAEIETHESCKIALPLVSFLASEIRRGINCHFTQPVFYSNNNNGSKQQYEVFLPKMTHVANKRKATFYRCRRAIL